MTTTEYNVESNETIKVILYAIGTTIIAECNDLIDNIMPNFINIFVS